MSVLFFFRLRSTYSCIYTHKVAKGKEGLSAKYVGSTGGECSRSPTETRAAQKSALTAAPLSGNEEKKRVRKSKDEAV
jgi:hypothetical protein